VLATGAPLQMGVFAFGDITFHGTMCGRPRNASVAEMAADSSTGGYRIVATDWGIVSFDTPFYGAG
jgi:hypothetical protein